MTNLKMNVNKVMPKSNVDDRRPHLDGAEDDGRHVGKRALGMQRRPGIAEPQGKAFDAHHQLSKNTWLFIFEKLSDTI